MRRLRTGRVALLLGCAVLTGSASSPTLEDAVVKGLAAIGGARAIRSVQALRMTGSISFGDAQRHPMTVELQRPSRIRTEVDFGEKGMLIQAFDGTRGWTINPFSADGAATPMSEPEARNAREQADLDGPLLDWKERGLSLTLLPPIQVEGQDAYAIRVDLPGGVQRTLSLDAATGRKLKWEGAADQNGKPVVFESLFEDYRAVGSLSLPFRIRSRAQGSERTQVIQFEKIEIDPALPASRFQMPPASEATPTPPDPSSRRP
jgi:outer membrane lipoprotein-sorting protein